MHIKDWIRGRRAERGQTQPEAAEHVGVSDRTWGKWERGELVPDRLAYLAALSTWGGVSFGKLSEMAIDSVLADDAADGEAA